MKKKPKSFSSTGSKLEPYQLGFTENPIGDKQIRGNEAAKTFADIAHKRANRNGIPLMTPEQFDKFKPINK